MTLILPTVPTAPQVDDLPTWLWWAVPAVAVLILVLCGVAVVSEWRRKRRETPPQPPETTRRRKGRTHP